MATVASVRASYDDCYAGVKRAIELCGGLSLGHHDKIVIKINFCDARTPETGAVTHPAFLDALLRYVRETYPDLPVYVVESDGAVVLADQFVTWFGYQVILDKWGVPFVNLSLDEAEVRRINGLHFAEMAVPRIFANSFFITLAKLKTNALSQITCALKNQYGCNPEVDKAQYHPVLDKAIADVNLAYPPDFCIVDGILGQGGIQGPAFGIPIPAGVIIAGADPVATDVVCARAMGIHPRLVGHIWTCAKVGVGRPAYRLVGDPLPDVDFQVSVAGMLVFKMGVNLKQRSDRKRRDQGRFRVAPVGGQHVPSLGLRTPAGSADAGLQEAPADAADAAPLITPHPVEA